MHRYPQSCPIYIQTAQHNFAFVQDFTSIISYLCLCHHVANSALARYRYIYFKRNILHQVFYSLK